MRQKTLVTALTTIFTFAILGILIPRADTQDMPFGGPDDVAFAGKLWTAMDGYHDWKMQSDYYTGQSPHGDIVRLYYSMATIDGTHYHVIAKDNFRGDNLTADMVAKAPDKYFTSATVMLQREAGYDPDNQNWFWAKYGPDGALMANPKGMKFAGRVAKGMSQGCISCHSQAKDDDYLFSNDR